jgi:hypothetical protein
MHAFRAALCCLVLLAACTSPAPVDQPYESCTLNEGCSQGTGCLATTLPASAGFTGASCTTGCSQDADCLQDLNNYDAICVNGQCYIECPGGGASCPYGTGCLNFSDQNGGDVTVCTP